jgi:hypothetical protein
MSEPAPTAAPAPAPDAGRRTRSAARLVLYAAILLAAAAGVWFSFGRNLWNDYQKLQTEVRASEDNSPVGYIGLNYRRSYNDRPVVFHGTEGGRKTLFASKLEGGKPEVYDVTDAAFDVQCLDGGYGRDSIPGVDYPIIEAPSSSRGRSLRARQEVFGVLLSGGPRAYPKDLLAKVEVVNDRDDKAPFAVVYDRSRERALLFERTVSDQAITFGTTGYSCKERPLLYDRKTRSLWLLEGDELTCVNGTLKGAKAKSYLTAEPTSWEDWRRRQPTTSVLIGNDRTKAIPAE